jgi:dTDP-4-amino-4,6-dideoxygalactose transaminase
MSSFTGETEVKKIEFFRHDITEEDIARAGRVMRSVLLTTGPVVAELEERLARFCGVPEAVALTSCTGALHLALLRHEVGPGDEVITTPMTFVATATAILETGARPVFIDVNPASGLLEPASVEAGITGRTKAIVPVHLYGRMVDMRGFSEVARKSGLVLIEDAAHCLEGMRDGMRPGQLSRAACFSFYATKSMTCGEGGALVCRDGEDALWYRAARHHGITRPAAARHGRAFRHWDMEMMGWKYNLPDLQAALLVSQVERLEEHRGRREKLEALYRECLAEVEGLGFLEPAVEGERGSHHLFSILVPEGISRDAVATALQEAGIGCAVNYRAVHTLKYFHERHRYRPEDFPVADRIGRRTLSLPLYPKLSEGEVEHVCRTLRAIFDTRR